MAAHGEPRRTRSFIPRAGVYSITCRATGRTYVGCTDHLLGAMNSHRLGLSSGMHPNAAMQADWDAHGDDAFDFSIHEEVTPEEPAAVTAPALNALRDLWVDQLGLDEGSTY